MKKITLIFLMVAMVFVLTACWGQKEEQQTEPQPAATTEEKQAGETTGIVEDLSDGELTIYTKAKESLTFNIENARIESENDIESGDFATLEYTGRIQDGDTSDCDVTKVTCEPGERSVITGRVTTVDLPDNKIVITSEDKEYVFDVTDVKGQAEKVDEGATVTVKYVGVINNTNTGHAFVKNLVVNKASEEAGEAPEQKSVNQKVWTTKKVTVRAGASSDSEKVGKIKKGTKLKRLGILDNGWSRVIYQDKDRYVKTRFLTTKKPKKKAKSVVTTESEKTTTAKKETTKEKTTAEEKESAGEEPSSEQKSKKKKSSEKVSTTEEQATPEEEQTNPEGEQTAPEEQPTPEEQTNPEGEQTTPEEEQTTPEEQTNPEEEQTTPEEEPATLTDEGVVTDIDENYLTLDNGNRYKIRNAEVDASSIEMTMDKKVKVEYTEGTDEATHIYLVDSEKATEAEGANGLIPAVIIGVIVVLLGGAYTIVRKRKANDSK